MHVLAVDPEMHIRVCVYVNVCARLLVCLRAGGLLSRWSVVVYSGSVVYTKVSGTLLIWASLQVMPRARKQETTGRVVCGTV